MTGLNRYNKCKVPGRHNSRKYWEIEINSLISRTESTCKHSCFESSRSFVPVMKA